MENQLYDNPLIGRYASREMSELWGPQRKFSTWRRLWLALAEAQQELGLAAGDGITPRIRTEQLAELRSHLDDIDLGRAAELEKKLRHDVMAHIHTYGERCPGARDILHLGATSCDITDNADLLLIRSALAMIRDRLVDAVRALANFAKKWRDLPTLGFTHFQPAQLTTVGKRASLWCYDFFLDLTETENLLATLPFRGIKGTTGTQASFLALFLGDHNKVRQLDELVAKKMGFTYILPVTGQTYSRKIDSHVLDLLSGICQSGHKFATDIRLLQHRQEVEEPFEAEQVGSSAMPYKRNPMRCERLCGIARFVMSLSADTAQNAALQWLERTLDDSANRRLVIPQAFLGVDSVLRLALNVSSGLVVNKEVIKRNVDLALPYMATENILMAEVAQGGDRQLLHESIRKHSMTVTESLKHGATTNDLVERLRSDAAFGRVDFDRVMAIENFIGRAPEQVDELLNLLEPQLARYGAGEANAQISL
jgi:adenylosuccinate lyase